VKINCFSETVFEGFIEGLNISIGISRHKKGIWEKRAASVTLKLYGLWLEIQTQLTYLLGHFITSWKTSCHLLPPARL
jgi:hypothetical protein